MAQPPLYDPEAVKPMWEELVEVGFEPLTTAEEVDKAIEKKGTVLLFVNSVCGCAAGSARPGLKLALQNSVIPESLTTVFAGMDREAVDQARNHINVPPSSPAMAIFKDGEPIFALQRHQIEQMNPEMLAEVLIEVFDKECTRKGPSIPAEEYAKLSNIVVCGSSVPKFGM